MAKDKKSKIENSTISGKNELQAIVSFDVYFQGLMREKRGQVLAHHKAPMRKYAENLGLTHGTKEQFDDLFKLY